MRLAKPYMLSLFTTNLCNLNCVYCSTDAGIAFKNELTFEEKKDIIFQAKNLGINSVVLSGSGEPLLDKDFDSLVIYSRSLDIIPMVVTNGTLITRKKAKFLKDNGCYVVFKLNAFNKKISDLLVGKKNAYDLVNFGDKMIPSGLKYLIDVGMNIKSDDDSPWNYRLKIECVITKHNFNEIPLIAQFCKDNNVYFFLENLIWVGRAKENYSSLHLSRKDHNWLYSQLAKILGIGFVLQQKKVSCDVERNVVVGTVGEVLICHSRNKCVGNVRETDLGELYNLAQIERKKQSIPFYKGFNNSFKTCSGREYHIKNLILDNQNGKK